VEIGLYTFGDLPFGVSGPEASRNRLAEIVKAAQLADQAGLDVLASVSITDQTTPSLCPALC
jgi:hypothetical protein